MVSLCSLPAGRQVCAKTLCPVVKNKITENTEEYNTKDKEVLDGLFSLCPFA